MIRFAAAMVASLLVACVPQLRGECSDDAACPVGTSCREGLCLVSDAPRADAGQPTCEKACGPGYVCGDSLTCDPTFAPSMNIVTPVAHSLHRAASLSVLVEAVAPGGVDEVAVSLGELAPVKLEPSTEDANRFAGQLPVPAGTHGDQVLRATMSWSDGNETSEVTVGFDARGPTITTEPLLYPTRPARGQRPAAFLEGDEIQVYAQVDDAPAGVEKPPVLVDGDRRIAGEPAGPGRWRFTTTARAGVQVEALRDVTVEARDALGNTSAASLQARVSRQAWRWQSPVGTPVTAAPALVGEVLVFGDDNGVVTALRQKDGSVAWQVELDAAVVGHLTGSLGDDKTVHAVTRSGTAYWLDATDAPMPPTSRHLARCPETGTVGREPAAGPSLDRDTLFVVSVDGHLQLMGREPFTAPDGTSSCLLEHPLPEERGVASPSLNPRGAGVDVYVATQDGCIHRIDVGFESSGRPTFTHAWTQQASSAQEIVHGPPALGTGNSLLSIVVGTSTSRVLGRDAAGQNLSLNGKVLSSAIVAGPALVAGDAYFVDQEGEAQRVRLSDGRKLWSPAVRAASRSAGARAGPVVGHSGNACFVTGARLSCVSPSGEVNWTYDEPSGHALDLVTPALNCGGRLFVASAAGALEAIDTDTGGPADGWSSPGGDARHASNLSAPGRCQR